MDYRTNQEQIQEIWVTAAVSPAAPSSLQLPYQSSCDEGPGPPGSPPVPSSQPVTAEGLRRGCARVKPASFRSTLSGEDSPVKFCSSISAQTTVPQSVANGDHSALSSDDTGIGMTFLELLACPTLFNGSQSLQLQANHRRCIPCFSSGLLGGCCQPRPPTLAHAHARHSKGALTKRRPYACTLLAAEKQSSLLRGVSANLAEDAASVASRRDMPFKGYWRGDGRGFGAQRHVTEFIPLQDSDSGCDCGPMEMSSLTSPSVSMQVPVNLETTSKNPITIISDTVRRQKAPNDKQRPWGKLSGKAGCTSGNDFQVSFLKCSPFVDAPRANHTLGPSDMVEQDGGEVSSRVLDITDVMVT
ncbi:hypothetical protein A6R68_05039, partial [Neotoma lepida]